MKQQIVINTVAASAIAANPNRDPRVDATCPAFPIVIANLTTAPPTLPACNCHEQAPTYPVFRPTPHLPGCPSYRP